MKSSSFPRVEFGNIEQRNPDWSTWTCFCEAIKGKKSLSRKVIRKYFNLLVDPEDYDAEEKSNLLDFLCQRAKDED